MQMTALVINNVSFSAFKFRDASKGIERHLNQTENAVFFFL